MSFLEDLTRGGDPVLLVVVAVLAVAGLVVERLLLARGWHPYFAFGFPLGEELVPVPLAPEGEGRTASVRWAVDEDRGVVRFWAGPGDRTAPMGLHGEVALVRGPRGIHLPVRWAPSWTPLLALVWFAGLGLAQGSGHVTVPVGLGLAGLLLVLYRQAAVRAARELRWAFVDRRDGPPRGPSRG
jgi:hypothetical protein